MRKPRPFFRKQTKSWYVQLGKQQVNLGKDKELAWARYHELMLNHQRDASIQDDTVAALVEAHWQWLKANRAESTARTRKPFLKSFRLWAGEKMRVWQLKPHHVQKWCTETYGNQSTTYQNIAVNTICRAFSWAAKAGMIGKSPLAGMEKPRAKVRQEFLPAEVWPKLLAAATDEAFLDWLKVMLLSGARVQEMFRFEAQYFDRNGSRIILPIEESKGKRRSRVIYLPDEAAEIVAKWADKNPSGPIFRNRRGRPWNRNSIRCRFRRLKKILDEPKLTATTLRHSFAHHRLTNGQDSLVVSKLMGHVDGRMLATRYGHLDQNPDFLLQQANRVATPLSLPSVFPLPASVPSPQV